MASSTVVWIRHRGISGYWFPFLWFHRVVWQPLPSLLSTAILWELFVVSATWSIGRPRDGDFCCATKPAIQAWRTLQRQRRVPFRCSTGPVSPIWRHCQWCTHTKSPKTSISMAMIPKCRESPDHSFRQSGKSFKLVFIFLFKRWSDQVMWFILYINLHRW